MVRVCTGNPGANTEGAHSSIRSFLAGFSQTRSISLIAPGAFSYNAKYSFMIWDKVH